MGSRQKRRFEVEPLASPVGGRGDDSDDGWCTTPGGSVAATPRLNACDSPRSSACGSSASAESPWFRMEARHTDLPAFGWNRQHSQPMCLSELSSCLDTAAAEPRASAMSASSASSSSSASSRRPFASPAAPKLPSRPAPRGVHAVPAWCGGAAPDAAPRKPAFRRVGAAWTPPPVDRPSAPEVAMR
uniref:Uncharacterized protein n=1 Tax=Emiliania huxleyi TaxID=2903 RepID=A0A6T0HKM1_EMIHU|mmetsp:Transcript_30574/g.90791  ORF Transcript_30574/g.90791 Transcript_30574/m.90791 type:complete len:187 (+) Transcript_30574:104-664(+)